ncbi:MAG TPA: hypothetical protein VF773_21720 [Verrucomicrobiae bacterium]
MVQAYLEIFAELIRTPFERTDAVWGVVPLYFSWAFAELTGEKPNYKTAIQTGFNLLWAGAQWTWPYYRIFKFEEGVDLGALFAVKAIVTIVTIALGALALYSGLRKRFPKYCSFLGRTRFSSYFTIALFPIQANHLDWTWARLIAIFIFAIPTWIIFGLMRRGLAGVGSATKPKARR